MPRCPNDNCSGQSLNMLDFVTVEIDDSDEDYWPYQCPTCLSYYHVHFKPNTDVSLICTKTSSATGKSISGDLRTHLQAKINELGVIKQ